MECPFVVGDEVVCVDATPETPVQAGLLSEGQVYVVAAHGAPGPYSGVHRIQVQGVSVFGDHLTEWRWTRFRKVQNPRTTVEQFTRVPVGDTSRWDKSRRAPAKTPEKADV